MGEYLPRAGGLVQLAAESVELRAEHVGRYGTGGAGIGARLVHAAIVASRPPPRDDLETRERCNLCLAVVLARDAGAGGIEVRRSG